MINLVNDNIMELDDRTLRVVISIKNEQESEAITNYHLSIDEAFTLLLDLIAALNYKGSNAMQWRELLEQLDKDLELEYYGNSKLLHD